MQLWIKVLILGLSSYNKTLQIDQWIFSFILVSIIDKLCQLRHIVACRYQEWTLERGGRTRRRGVSWLGNLTSITLSWNEEITAFVLGKSLQPFHQESIGILSWWKDQLPSITDKHKKFIRVSLSRKMPHPQNYHLIRWDQMRCWCKRTQLQLGIQEIVYLLLQGERFKKSALIIFSSMEPPKSTNAFRFLYGQLKKTKWSNRSTCREDLYSKHIRWSKRQRHL